MENKQEIERLYKQLVGKRVKVSNITMSEIDDKISKELNRRRGLRTIKSQHIEKPTKFEVDYGDSIWYYDLKKFPNGPIKVVNKN